MAELPRAFGPYVLLKALGSGGTSDVYLARPADPTLGLPTPLVIKRLHGELATQDALFRRFTHEARITAALESQHLPRLFDVGRVGEAAYIAMEYLTGWTVARLITDLQGAGKHASIASAVDLAAGALEALSALHEARDRETGAPLEIVHRDVAPKNVMLGEDGVTRLIDFGLGKSRIQEWKTETGVVLGTPGYMSPEQVRAEPVDHRSDLYAMGIVLWELLTLKTYIRRGPVPLMLRAQASPSFAPAASHRADVPRALDEVLRVALAPEPQQRFPSALAFLDALRTAVPPDEELDPLPTLVGEMLWGELHQEKSQVTQLLQRPSFAPAGQPGAAIVPLPAPEVLQPGLQLGAPQPGAAGLQPGSPGPAQPGGHAPLPPGFQVVSQPGLQSGAQQVFPGLHPQQLTPGPQPVYTPGPFPPPSAGGVPMRTVLALLLVTLALGVSFGALMQWRNGRGDAEATVTVEHLTEPAVQRPAVAAQPSAVRATEQPLPAGDPSRVEGESGEVKVDPAARAAARPALAHKTAATAATPEAAAEPSLEERTQRLLARAKALRGRLVGGTPAQASATSLMSKLLMEASSPNTEGQAARLGQLEAELGRLELEDH